MSHLNIKQLKGPNSGASGSAIVFEAGRPVWSDNLNTALLLPKGNTAASPASAANGMLRYNTQTNKLEAYEANAWKPVISDAELLKRFSVKVNFDTSGKLSSVTELPPGWTVNAVGSPSANEFSIITNVGKQPYDFTILGQMTSGGTSYWTRPKSQAISMNIDTTIPDRINFTGVTSSLSGAPSSGGHSFFWIYF